MPDMSKPIPPEIEKELNKELLVPANTRLDELLKFFNTKVGAEKAAMSKRDSSGVTFGPVTVPVPPMFKDDSDIKRYLDDKERIERHDGMMGWLSGKGGAGGSGTSSGTSFLSGGTETSTTSMLEAAKMLKEQEIMKSAWNVLWQPEVEPLQPPVDKDADKPTEGSNVGTW